MAQAHLPSLWPAKCNGAALLTTFTFDPDFFELALLPELLNRGAWPIVLFVDLGSGAVPAMEQVEALREAGRTYLLVPVDLAPHSFHPKVHFFAHENLAVVGSGNLTPSGCGWNLEVADRLVGKEDGHAVAAVRAFFRDLLRDVRCRMAPADRARLAALLPEDEDPSGGDALFLHTLATPGSKLEVDWRERLFDQPATELIAAAPFIDEDSRTMRALIERIRPGEARLVADPVVGRALAGVQPSRLEEVIAGDEKSRRQHAKLVHVRTGQTSCVLSGSANLTEAAWTGRNVEAVVVRRDLDPAAFDSLYEDVRVVPSAWQAPVRKRQEPAPALPAIVARWARLEGDRVLLSVDRVPGMAVYLDTDGCRTPLSLEPSRPGEEHGPLPTNGKGEPVTLPRSAVIRCRAEGYRDGLVVLSHLSRPPAPGGSRLRRDLDDLAAGIIDDDRVNDLRGRLFDFLRASLQAPEASPETTHPVADAPSRAGAAPRKGSGDAALPVLEVEEILSRAGPAAGRHAIRGRDMRLLIAGLVAPRARNAPPTPGGRAEPDREEWTPADIAGTGHATEGDPEEDAPVATNPPASDDADEPEDTPPGKMAKDLAAFVAHCDASHLVPSPEIVGAVQGAAHDILSNTDASKVGAAHAKFRAGVALRVLERAWAVPEWPKTSSAWVAHAGVDLRREALSVLVSALRMMGSPSPRDALAGIGPSIRDQAARVLQGLGAAEPCGAADHELLSAVRAHVPRDQAAVGPLTALWELELATRELERVSTLLGPVRKALDDAVTTCRNLSRRNLRHKEAAALIPELTARLTALELQRSAAFSRAEAAAVALRTTPPRGLDGSDAVASWARSGPARRAPRRRVVARSDASNLNVCPGCNATLSGQVVEAMRDPGLVTRCTSCTSLIAAGPPREQT